MPGHRRAHPFLRWAGGKSWLVENLYQLLPTLEPARYVEPFLGSGAVFFAIAPGSAVLSDVNSDLINAFKVVRDQPHDLLALLQSLKPTSEAYYKVRASRPRTAARRAARFLYLNRLGFNGIYRVNQRGEYNVPFGGHDRRLDFFWRDDRLLLASKALSGVDLRVADFEDPLSGVTSGDLAYCDPVYLVPSRTEYFDRYTNAPFDRGDLARLGAAVRAATLRGGVVVLSWPVGTRLVGFPDPARDVRLSRRSTVSATAKTATIQGERLLVFGDPSLVESA